MDNLERLAEQLRLHGKIHEVQVDADTNTVSCEVDRIQCVARGIVSRISDTIGSFTYKSSGKNTTNLGFTKVVITGTGE
jgi:hypothetical protein